jgi:hypothetical protein
MQLSASRIGSASAVSEKKYLYLRDLSDIGRTPDEVRQSILHALNEWAEAAQVTKGTSAFARSDWLSKSDRIGQGYIMHTTTPDLMADMQRRQEIVRVCKDAASLMCPTIFEKPLQLPDSLTAMGISIQSSVRAKEDALACRGFLLDIENGSMMPEDFAEVFPDLEFFAYSSWSHAQDAPRFRIGIPSTQLIPPEIHALTLHTIVDRLEAAGWGDALAGDRKHGVDIGKLHEAAMFYLPSKRADGFLAHMHEGRMPLDPREWVNHIPADLLTSPPPPVPSEIHHYEAALGHGDRQVQWSVDYWQKVGCVRGKGRTQLWLLAKRLAGAGLDDEEMRKILDEQAGRATNPEERRGEIEALLVDPQVVAARCEA